MTILYYGNGTCTIEGSEIRVMHIQYRGAIEIDSKDDSNIIMARKQGIIIFSLSGFLNELFDYVGEFKISSIWVMGDNGRVPTTIHRVMDYTELLNTKSEDMTTKSEDLSSTYVSGRKVAKTFLKQQYWENLNTSTDGGEYYLKDGSLYHGGLKIDLRNSEIVTDGGESLFYKNGKPTKNLNSIPPAYIEHRRRRRLRIREDLRKRRKR